MRRLWSLVFCAALVVGAAACTDDSGDPGGNTLDSDTGTTGDDTGGTGSDTGTVSDDTGGTVDDTGGGGGVDLPPSPDNVWTRTACAGAPSGTATWPAELTLAAGGTRTPRIIIEAVSFADGAGDADFIVVRNVSSAVVVFNSVDTARESWRLYVDNSNFFLPVGFNLQPGESVTIWTRKSGATDNNGRHIHLSSSNRAADLDVAEGEVSIFHATDQEFLNDPDVLEAFVAWGANPGTVDSATRRDEAVEAGLWEGETIVDFVPTSGTDVGILATGDVSTVAGWSAADVDCFQAN